MLTMILDVLDLNLSEFAFEPGDGCAELWYFVQSPQAGIALKQRPTSKTFVNRSFQPFQGFAGLPENGVRTCDLIVRVVRVPERTRRLAGPLNTIQSRSGILMKSVQHAFQANHQRLFGEKSQRCSNIFFRRLQVAAKQRRLRPKPQEILVFGALLRPSIKFPFGTVQVTVPKIRLRDVVIR